MITLSTNNAYNEQTIKKNQYRKEHNQEQIVCTAKENLIND